MNIWANRFFLKLMRLLLGAVFRFRAFNEQATKCEGPALIIPNHLSWVDWLFVGLCVSPDWMFAASEMPARTSKLHAWILSNPRIILIGAEPTASLKKMTTHLEGGGKLILGGWTKILGGGT